MWRKALLVVLVLVAAGCSDSEGDSPPPTVSDGGLTTTEPSVAATTTTATAVSGSACPATPFTGTIERTFEAVTGSGTHVAAARTDGELVSAYAYSFGTGDTYTVYVGDHQIDKDGVGSATLTAPPGGLLATIFLQATEQLVAGSVVDFGFVPIIDTGGGAEVSGFGADDLSGSATIQAIDSFICFEINTSDPQQEVHGVVSAEIVN